MIAGLMLKEREEQETVLAFLGEEVECLTVNTNREIVAAVKQRKPEVLASNAGVEEPRKGLTKQEEKLKEEGYSFTPASDDSKRVRRMEALKAYLFEEMGSDSPEIIRFNPFITAEELAIHSDDALESYGIDPSGIATAEEFDAVLGAVTARFYQQNSVEDLGVIVPDTLRENESGRNT